MTDTAMLNQIIRESGLKKSYIAKCLGLSAYGFSRKLNNLAEFTASEIDALCRLLGIKSMTKRFAIFFARKVDE